MNSAYRALNGPFSMGFHFPLDCICPPTIVTKSQKQTGLFLVGSCVASWVLDVSIVCKHLDRVCWWCCQQSRKPARWWNWLSHDCSRRHSILSHRDHMGHMPIPALRCDSTRAFSLNRSSLGFVFTISWMVICMSIAGDGLCHSNLTPRLRELHCCLFSPDLDKLTCNS